METNDWRDIAFHFDAFSCQCVRLSIKGLVLRFSVRNRKQFGQTAYYRRVDDDTGTRFPTETSAARWHA